MDKENGSNSSCEGVRKRPRTPPSAEEPCGPPRKALSRSASTPTPFTSPRSSGNKTRKSSNMDTKPTRPLSSLTNSQTNQQQPIEEAANAGSGEVENHLVKSLSNTGILKRANTLLGGLFTSNSDPSVLMSDGVSGELSKLSGYRFGTPTPVKQRGERKRGPRVQTEETYTTSKVFPHDNSLKDSLVFESFHPFNWCKVIPAATEARGLQRFMSQSSAPYREEPCTSEAEALERWVAATMYYMYPAEPLPSALLDILKIVRSSPAPFMKDPLEDDGEDSSFHFRRIRQWEDAFRGLYYSFLQKACPRFYYCCPLFTIAWSHSEGDSDEPQAVVSTSPPWLPQRLRENRVDFTMPFGTEQGLMDDQAKALSEEHKDDLDAMMEHTIIEEKRKKKTTTKAKDLARTMLIIKGKEAVHGLYDFLLDLRNTFTPNQGVDLPRLVATTPFPYATLKRAHISLSTEKKPFIHGSPGGQLDWEGGRLQTMYYVSVRGTLLPEPVREMLYAMRYLQRVPAPAPSSPLTTITCKDMEVEEGEEEMVARQTWKWDSSILTKHSTGAFNLCTSDSTTSYQTLKRVGWPGARDVFSVIADKEKEWGQQSTSFPSLKSPLD